MKIKGAKKVHYDSGPNMTPLVDIVMVILIFLMLTGTFTGAEHFLISNLPFSPKGAGQAKTPPGFVPDEPLDIRVDSPPTGGFYARIGNRQARNSDELLAVLKEKLAQFDHAGTKPEKVQVQISPGRNVQYKFLIEVYQAALEANFQKVAFANAH